MKKIIILAILISFSNIAAAAEVSLGTLLQGYMLYKQMEVLFGGIKAEKRIGNQVEQAFRSSTKPYDNPAALAWVNEIFDSLKPHAERDEIDYKVHAIIHEMVNAFALPNGTVFVTTGLLDLVESDDELACVLAHEISHVEESHSMHLMKKDVIFSNLISAVMSGDASARRLAGLMWQFTMLEYSRGHEMSADSHGCKIAWKAGYDPRALMDFLDKMSKLEGKEEVALFLRTHPTDKTRIAAVDSLITEFEPPVPKDMSRVLSFIRDAGMPPETIVPHGSFENIDVGSAPEGYVIQRGTAEVVSTERWTGENSLCCKPRAGMSRIMSPSFNIPSEPHVLTVQVLAPHGGQIISARFYGAEDKFLGSIELKETESNIQIVDHKSIGNYISDIWQRSGISSNWKTFSLAIDPGRNKAMDEASGNSSPGLIPEGALKMDIAIAVVGNNPVWLDDMIMRPHLKDDLRNPDAEKPSSVELLSNNSFEFDLDHDGKADLWHFDPPVELSYETCSSGYASTGFQITDEVKTTLWSGTMEILSTHGYILTFAAKGSGTVEVFLQTTDGLGEESWQKISRRGIAVLSPQFWKKFRFELPFPGPQKVVVREGSLIVNILSNNVFFDDFSLLRVKTGLQSQPKTWWKREWDPSEIGWGGSWLPPTKPWLPDGGM